MDIKMKFRSGLYSLARPFVLACLSFLILTTLSRAVLSVFWHENFHSLSDVISVFVSGFRSDISAIGWFISPCFLIWFIFGGTRLHAPVSALTRVILFAVLSAAVILEVSTGPFLEEYGVRPNRLYVEYLIYPKEVISMIVSGHIAAVAVCVPAAAVLVWLLWKFLRRVFAAEPARTGLLARCVFILLFSVISFGAARGTLGHRPLNPAYLAFSSDSLLNALGINSPYSLGYALYSMAGQNSKNIYEGIGDDEIVRRVRMDLGLSGIAPEDAPTLHSLESSYPGRKLNVVILLQESLGADYVGVLTGGNLTPNVDAVYREGWGFYSLYATGTRSVRGIEAVTTGFTPTYNSAVVKLPCGESDFFSIASVLKDRGYDTSFIYGGESHFDNMKSFFLRNGYSRIIDQDSYENPSFTATWGVSDEDLYNRADVEFARLESEGKNFYSLVFTSSNHDPFEIPAGKTEPVESPLFTRKNAVKYSDWAFGRFLEKAKKSSYWKNTVFLLIADHDARTYAAADFPVRHFHIPAVIFGGPVEKREDRRLVSQMDMVPTLLSIAGVSAEIPVPGYDLTKKAEIRERAVMQYQNNDFAMLRKNGDLVILRPEKEPIFRKYDFASGKIGGAVPADTEFYRTALSYAVFGLSSCRNGWYSYSRTKSK